nr:uncharacterized protein LOC119624400 [Chlorocebus sabaeus]
MAGQDPLQARNLRCGFNLTLPSLRSPRADGAARIHGAAPEALSLFVRSWLRPPAVLTLPAATKGQMRTKDVARAACFMEPESWWGGSFLGAAGATQAVAATRALLCSWVPGIGRSPALPGAAAATQAGAVDPGISVLLGAQEGPLSLQARKCLLPLSGFSSLLAPAPLTDHNLGHCLSPHCHIPAACVHAWSSADMPAPWSPSDFGG